MFTYRTDFYIIPMANPTIPSPAAATPSVGAGAAFSGSPVASVRRTVVGSEPGRLAVSSVGFELPGTVLVGLPERTVKEADVAPAVVENT